MEVSIGISNRHVHLTKEVYEKLFDDEMIVERYLNQPGEFVSNKSLTIIINDKEISNVKVLGPFRGYNQVEISRKDSLHLDVNPPVRASGDLNGAADVTLKTQKGSVTVPAAIIAQRHIHMSKEKALELGVVDKQKVQIKFDGEKSGIIDTYIKISENGYFEAHIDTDDACAFLLENGSKGTLII